MKWGKEFYMKTFFTRIMVILLGCLYLLYCPIFYTHSIALAQKSFSGGTQQSISDAHKMSLGKKYKKKLFANDISYFYIPYRNEFSFFLKSTKVQNITVTFLEDSGKKLPCSTSTKKNRKKYTWKGTHSENKQFIFIQLKNQSSYDISLNLWVERLQKEKSSDKKKSNKSNNPLQKSISKKAKEKLSTIKSKKLTLNPHFLIINPQSSKKLSFQGIKQSELEKNYTLILTNPKIATIKNNKIYAISEGVTIIYLQSKHSKQKNSSCLVRIIEKEKISKK